MSEVILATGNSKRSRIEFLVQSQDYLNYINEHIQNVQKACEIFIRLNSDKLINLLSNEYSKTDILDAIQACMVEIKTHDDSKYSDEEFEGYRKKYYPTSEEKKKENEDLIEEEYKQAWEHHYRNNPHHPDYWVDEKGNLQDMNLTSILHMICDWEGMSLKFHTDTLKWYDEKAIKDEQKKMSDHTKSIVRKILVFFHEVDV